MLGQRFVSRATSRHLALSSDLYARIPFRTKCTRHIRTHILRKKNTPESNQQQQSYLFGTVSGLTTVRRFQKSMTSLSQSWPELRQPAKCTRKSSERKWLG